MTTAPKKTARPAAAPAAEIAEKVAGLAGQSLDKAQETANKVTEAAHGNVQLFDAAAGALRAGIVEMQLKAIEIAQANADAGFGFMRELLAARDPQTLAKANMEFVQRQAAEIARQVREINEMAARCARDTAKPAQDGLARSFAELTRSFAA